MSVVHISEEEALRDFAGVLARIDRGEEVTIDRKNHNMPVHITRGVPVGELFENAKPQEGSLEYLSEFRERHPEPIDGSKWE